jgi:IS5 family transposase
MVREALGALPVKAVSPALRFTTRLPTTRRGQGAVHLAPITTGAELEQRAAPSTPCPSETVAHASTPRTPLSCPPVGATGTNTPSARLRDMRAGELTLPALALFYARGRDASTSPVLRGELLGELRSLFLRIRVAGDKPHTDIIIKDRRETLYGHKVCLTTGASGLVLDLVVQRGNPADSTLAHSMVVRVASVLGKTPKQVSFDGGFSSRANVHAIKAMGVQDVVFSKHVGLDVADMAKSQWVFRQLRNFRAGIEGAISFLKRTFRLGRCNWSGFESFRAYAWGSVLACNLLVVARHLLD